MVMFELRSRASRIRAVLTDCDGVLTDGGLYYSASGEELKRFSMRDGLGVELLTNAGVATAIVSTESSPSIGRRADKLGIRAFLGVRDKAAALEGIAAELGVALRDVAFIGDDVNDLGLIRRVNESGLTGAPHDAVHGVLELVHHRSLARGGHGAFRDFADWILELAASVDLARNDGAG